MEPGCSSLTSRLLWGNLDEPYIRVTKSNLEVAQSNLEVDVEGSLALKLGSDPGPNPSKKRLGTGFHH